MEIKNYLTDTGSDVVNDWLNSLRDRQARSAIIRRLYRIEGGNLGPVRHLRKGVWELKIDFGPGYRVYYAQEGQSIILLLCGGDKGSQDADIDRAVSYLEDHLQRARRVS